MRVIKLWCEMIWFVIYVVYYTPSNTTSAKKRHLAFFSTFSDLFLEFFRRLKWHTFSSFQAGLKKRLLQLVWKRGLKSVSLQSTEKEVWKRAYCRPVWKEVWKHSFSALFRHFSGFFIKHDWTSLTLFCYIFS